MLPRRVEHRKLAGRGGRYRRRVEHEGSGVIEERLTLQDGEQPPGQADPPGHAVAAAASVGPTAVPEHERDRPGQVAEPMSYGRHAEGGGDDQEDGERADGAGITVKPGGRRRDGGVEDKQREQAEQDHVGFEGDVRHKRQEPDDQPGHDQYYRRRDPRLAENGTATRVTDATQRMMSNWPELTLEYW